MKKILLSCVLCVSTVLISAAQTPDRPSSADQALKARIEASPVLPFTFTPVSARFDDTAMKAESVSSLAFAGPGKMYEVQRGDKADPVLILDHTGKVLRSWGKGDFTIPHTVRVDPQGDVWVVDAGASRAIKYSPRGVRLMTISVGEPPQNGSAFQGATDIAFGPDGHIYISDGYGNARVLEYTANGVRVRQWGTAGAGLGQFHLPHALQVGSDGTVYVADRENGRVEEFDSQGKYLREIAQLGRVYSIKLAGEVLWASMGSFAQPPGSGDAWVVKLDRRTGKLLGHLDVHAARAGHSLEVTPAGEPVITAGDQLLWFRAK